MPGRTSSTLGFIECELLKTPSVGAIANALVLLLELVEHRRKSTPLEGPPLSGRHVATGAQFCADDAVFGVGYNANTHATSLSLCFAFLGKPQVNPHKLREFRR